MRKMILAGILAGLFVGPSVASEWYNGGTLHRSNLATWSSASDQNRLATSADYTTAMMKGRKDWRSMEEVKAWARQLQRCIDEVAVDRSLGSLSASEIGASCAILLGWR